MVVLKSLLIAATFIAGTTCIPYSDAMGTAASILPRSGTPSTSEPYQGYYSYWLNDDQGTAYYTRNAAGQFTAQWSGGWVIGGRGWNPGTYTRAVSYTGIYKPEAGLSLLGVIGWLRNPLTQYYVVESYGSEDPSAGATKKGTVICDGATYDILQTTLYNQPSIDGNQTFQQFWSVRNPKRAPGGTTSGTITMYCHFKAWTQNGMISTSNFNYQIFGIEARSSNGSASINVSG